MLQVLRDGRMGDWNGVQTLDVVLSLLVHTHIVINQWVSLPYFEDVGRVVSVLGAVATFGDPMHADSTVRRVEHCYSTYPTAGIRDLALAGVPSRT